jgi:hypothetical protein
LALALGADREDFGLLILAVAVLSRSRADRPLSPNVGTTLEPVDRDGRRRYEVSRSTRQATRLTARATAR